MFHTARLPQFAKFYRIVPALLMAYFLPAILNSTGIIEAGEGSNVLRGQPLFAARQPAHVLPVHRHQGHPEPRSQGAHHVLCGHTRHRGGWTGGPLAGEPHSTDVLGGDAPDALWRGLSTIAGSWIGGGANQTALKEIAQAQDDQFSVMIIVDVFVANLWMPFLLIGAGVSAAIDSGSRRRLPSTPSKKSGGLSAKHRTDPPFNDLMVLFGVIFSWSAWPFAGDGISQGIGNTFDSALERNPDSPVRFLSSLTSHFFWLVFLSTGFGVALSFTPMKTYEGAGASKMASVFLYVLVATIGAKMDIGELYHSWERYWPVIVIGLLWMLVHVIILLAVAKLIRAPFFFVAVGSQANVGGAASAPIVASAFSPALAPVGVLLAVLGYAVGTVAAVVCMEFMRFLSGGG